MGESGILRATTAGAMIGFYHGRISDLKKEEVISAANVKNQGMELHI